MGRPQQGKPPYDPPPPTPEPQVAGYGPAAGQLPYQQPLSFGLQGMAPAPQPAGYAPQPVAGFAPQPAAGFPPPTFTVSFFHEAVFVLYSCIFVNLFIYLFTP